MWGLWELYSAKKKKKKILFLCNDLWSIDTINLIDTTLRKLPKATTPQLVYQQKFLEFKNKYPTTTFIYADGFKISGATSFSVVSNDVSQQHLLPYYSSIFSAEIIAIYNAVLLAQHWPNSSVICSSSNNSFYPVTIRQILLKTLTK